MSYYIATLNAGDTDRRAYKKADDIGKKATSLMNNITEERARDLVKDISIFESKKQLDTDLQLLLFSHFDKVKDRPSKYIYAVLKWASLYSIPITKQALRGAYKKTFGHQLDYRYVRIVSHYFKLQFYRGSVQAIVEKESGNPHQEAVISLLTNANNNPLVIVPEADTEDETSWQVEESEEDCVNTEEVSIEPTANLETALINQRNTIKQMIKFLEERDLMVDYILYSANN